jgi:hypothetical protein
MAGRERSLGAMAERERSLGAMAERKRTYNAIRLFYMLLFVGSNEAVTVRCHKLAVIIILFDLI